METAPPTAPCWNKFIPVFPCAGHMFTLFSCYSNDILNNMKYNCTTHRSKLSCFIAIRRVGAPRGNNQRKNAIPLGKYRNCVQTNVPTVFKLDKYIHNYWSEWKISISKGTISQALICSSYLFPRSFTGVVTRSLCLLHGRAIRAMGRRVFTIPRKHTARQRSFTTHRLELMVS